MVSAVMVCSAGTSRRRAGDRIGYEGRGMMTEGMFRFMRGGWYRLKEFDERNLSNHPIGVPRRPLSGQMIRDDDV